MVEHLIIWWEYDLFTQQKISLGLGTTVYTSASQDPLQWWAPIIVDVT